VERRIADHITELIPDGATLQLGIGGIPDAVLSKLEGKRDLGIHTEMVSDGVMEAIEKGIITGRKKTLHQGKAVLTFVLGSQRLYQYVDNNPLFEAHPTEYTNDPFVVARNDNMIAINSAIEIDLTGQVCSDSIGARIYSGFGGQVDFIRGAAQSKGGKPIIALPSTVKEGAESRIVPFLKQGAGVVTSRGDVHYVVTEYGVAHLFGRSLRERAERLIAVAHPKFQDELEKAAKERKLL
jgi:acyl-CoA hydrolase